MSFKIPEHVLYYSPRSIRRLLGDAGFEVLSVTGAGQYVTIAFLLSRLERLAPRLTAGLAAGGRLLAACGSGRLHHQRLDRRRRPRDVSTRQAGLPGRLVARSSR